MNDVEINYFKMWNNYLTVYHVLSGRSLSAVIINTSSFFWLESEGTDVSVCIIDDSIILEQDLSPG